MKAIKNYFWEKESIFFDRNLLPTKRNISEGPIQIHPTENLFFFFFPKELELT